jgi:hypothetical protein
MSFCELDTVRVARLLLSTRHVSSSFDPPIQPAVGDEGTVIDIQPGEFGVEDVDRNGYTRWFAYFTAEELTLVHRVGKESPTSPSNER